MWKAANRRLQDRRLGKRGTVSGPNIFWVARSPVGGRTAHGRRSVAGSINRTERRDGETGERAKRVQGARQWRVGELAGNGGRKG